MTMFLFTKYHLEIQFATDVICTDKDNNWVLLIHTTREWQAQQVGPNTEQRVCSTPTKLGWVKLGRFKRKTR